jgi:hypothetical protein
VSEANKFAMQVTPHTCNGTNHGPGYYTMCDWRGCFANTFIANPNGMCPGADCIIDTNRPFRHSIAFHTDADGRTLTSIRSTLQQDAREFSFPVCQDERYLATMTANLHGMVLTFSLWGSTEKGMSWLDGVTGCTGGCNVSASAAWWRDIELNTIR